MGGELSHEYHYKADIGEDKILTCPKCSYSANTEISGGKQCPKCGNQSIEISFGIEVVINESCFQGILIDHI
jgi:prolyl-tRNA synthetase